MRSFRFTRAHSRPAPARRAATHGFTLMEVLMALMIFALAAIVLSASYVNILNAYMIVERSAQTNADVAFARSLVLTEPDRKKLEQGGEFDTTDNRHVKWEVEIVSTSTADLFTVNFTCAVGALSEPEPQKTLQTFTVLRPTWSIDAAERSKLREDAKNRILELQGKNK